ncbi:hypothetical protein SAMN04489735_100238 [Aneurinibacillus thermoaerophilus]|uniref:Uncharacterized protein n=1 Tax=Aneurinibacillus thermoaerophilus TaxID=143495 RepID=A0A1G7WR29_ANETH|nr:hypothetical protein [Aneurinibacillus thermoaerophilus]SDG73690.1 hypothetical protein SAMN04489735_100238 [Aneurinibacillus thermoaerophilus]
MGYLKENNVNYLIPTTEKWLSFENLLKEGYTKEQLNRAYSLFCAHKETYRKMYYTFGFEACLRDILERGRV